MNRDDRFRILIVTPVLPPEYSGGGVQSLSLGQKLASLGISVAILAGTGRASSSPIYQTNIDKVSIFRIFRRRNSGFLGNLQYLIRFLVTMARLASRSDVIHFYGTRLYPLLGVPIAKAFKKLTIGTITLMGSDDPITLARRPFGIFKMLILQHLDMWVGLTREAVYTCVSSGIHPSRIRRVPIGINCEEFHPVSTQERDELRNRLFLPNHDIVVFAGIISFRKGIDILADAIPSVLEQKPRVSFIFVGPNTEEENPLVDSVLTNRLNALSRSTNNRVVLKGLVDNPLDYVRSSTVFVLPSRREGLSVAFLEAMSSGIPAVITNHPWLRDVGSDGVHFLEFEAESSESLIRGIIHLLDDESHRSQMAEEARARVKARFSMNKISLQYMEIYRRLIDKNSSIDFD